MLLGRKIISCLTQLANLVSYNKDGSGKRCPGATAAYINGNNYFLIRLLHMTDLMFRTINWCEIQLLTRSQALRDYHSTKWT